MRTIVVPTDGSAVARCALPVAVDLAKAEGARVVVVAVVEPEVIEGVPDQQLIDTMDEYLRGAVREEVEALTAEGVDAIGRVTCSPRAWKGIVEVAEETGADVILMSSHGRTGIARAALGSVADQVVRHSRIPVTVVPASAKGSAPGTAADGPS
jgi:nucleotide-binding universal stress UspA family protein